MDFSFDIQFDNGYCYEGENICYWHIISAMSKSAKVEVKTTKIKVIKPGMFYLRKYPELHARIISKLPKPERYWYENRVDKVWFAEPGIYSLSEIIKLAKSVGENYAYQILDKEKAYSWKSPERQIHSSVFSRGGTLCRTLFLPQNHESFKELEKTLVEAYKRGTHKLQTLDVEKNTGMVLDDRYVPIVSMRFKDYEQSIALATLNKDGSLRYFGNFKTKREELSQQRFFSLVYKKANEIASGGLNQFEGSEPPFTFFFYDKKRDKLILNEKVLERFKEKMSKRGRVTRFENTLPIPMLDMILPRLYGCSHIKDGTKELRAFFTTESGSDFKKRMNEYFIRKGITSLRVTHAFPWIHRGMRHTVDFRASTQDEGISYIQYIDAGYYLSVMHKGKYVVGRSPKSEDYCSTYIFVKPHEDGSIRLVHSSWCQHLTAWSNYAYEDDEEEYVDDGEWGYDEVIDQSYSHWDAADWLSGPFAERFNLEMKEMPFVFMGNKYSKSPERKLSVIERLRDQNQRMLRENAEDRDLPF